MTDDGWTPASMPDLAGTTAVVTGANSGLGLHTALELARHGARVVLACRDASRGAGALEQVRAMAAPGAEATLGTLDLADLASVRRFAAGLLDEVGPGGLQLLVNNAGVMALPHRRTADGFEMQLGTNHLGHFALTGLLLPALLPSAPGGAELGGGAPDPARVVTVSSFMHRTGRLRHHDLMHEKRYGKWSAYGQSKLANLLFTAELQRRADLAGLPLLSVAAHPGYASTNLQAAGPRMAGNRLGERFGALGNRLFAQPAEAGAWPTLRAATDPDAGPGDFYGPGALGGTRGAPVRSSRSRAALNPADAAWLWDRSAELTGVGFGALSPAR